MRACGQILNAVGGGPNKYELQIEEGIENCDSLTPCEKALIRFSHRNRL
jgi:hypothetical protein